MKEKYDRDKMELDMKCYSQKSEMET